MSFAYAIQISGLILPESISVSIEKLGQFLANFSVPRWSYCTLRHLEWFYISNDRFLWFTPFAILRSLFSLEWVLAFASFVQWRLSPYSTLLFWAVWWHYLVSHSIQRPHYNQSALQHLTPFALFVYFAKVDPDNEVFCVCICRKYIINYVV